MSEQPTIADLRPVAVKLKAGVEYQFCTCGKAAKQPFCDGSHKGTSFKPLAFSVPEDVVGHLCQCKYTGSPPYCSGVHKNLGYAYEQQQASKDH